MINYARGLLIAFFFGLKESNAVNASVFSNSEILFSMVIAIIVFRERLRLNEIGPFSMILFGMTALPIGYDVYQNGMQFSSILVGDALILSSGLLYAIDINICKYVSDRLDAKRITQITSFSAGGFALGLSFVFGIPFQINLEQIPALVLIAIVGTGLSTLFFFIGLRILGAMRTILLYSTTSIFGIIFSIILLGEVATMIDGLSVCITLVGIFLLRNKLAEDHELDNEAHVKIKGKGKRTRRSRLSFINNDLIGIKSKIVNFTLSRFCEPG